MELQPAKDILSHVPWREIGKLHNLTVGDLGPVSASNSGQVVEALGAIGVNTDDPASMVIERARVRELRDLGEGRFESVLSDEEHTLIFVRGLQNCLLLKRNTDDDAPGSLGGQPERSVSWSERTTPTRVQVTPDNAVYYGRVAPARRNQALQPQPEVRPEDILVDTIGEDMTALPHVVVTHDGKKLDGEVLTMVTSELRRLLAHRDEAVQMALRQAFDDRESPDLDIHRQPYYEPLREAGIVLESPTIRACAMAALQLGAEGQLQVRDPVDPEATKRLQEEIMQKARAGEKGEDWFIIPEGGKGKGISFGF